MITTNSNNLPNETPLQIFVKIESGIYIAVTKPIQITTHIKEKYQCDFYTLLRDNDIKDEYMMLSILYNGFTAFTDLGTIDDPVEEYTFNAVIEYRNNEQR